MKKLSILLASILMATSLSAKTMGITSYESAKQKAMGGATILSEVNENALINNPALLNEIKGWELNIFGIASSVSAETPEIMDGITSMLDDVDKLGDAEDKIVNLLAAYLDGKQYIDGGKVYNQDLHKLSNKKLVLEVTNVIGAFAKRGFGVGVFTAVNVNDLRLVNKPSSPEIIVDIGATVQVPVGLAMDFGKNNQYIVGTSIKGIAGANARAKANAGDLAGGDDTDIPITVESYSGLAVDLGAIYKSKYLNYAFTVNNAFGKIEAVETKNDIETDIDRELPTVINVAISNKFDKKDRLDTWWDKHAFWTLELKNITNADINGDGYDDENFYKKIHLGASSHVFNNNWVRLELRGGLNQGYPTFGFGSELFSFLNLDYAYSTREAGLTVGSKPETLHTISLDFRM